MKLSALTGRNNYFEDFVVGVVIRHARGKTIEGLENVLITNLVMNTAQAHFNEHAMRNTPFGGRLSYGGVNFSVAMGLAMQDCGENALAGGNASVAAGAVVAAVGSCDPPVGLQAAMRRANTNRASQ